MKTESHSIHDVLSKNATSFMIPPFQRAYSWGRPEIERYFFDIIRIIESELDQKQHDKLEHFFGTLVIKEEKSGFANSSIVIDGQQRLTTTLIFLIALRDAETDDDIKQFIEQNYLINPSSTFQDKIKLKQVTKDWESYRSLVNKERANPGIINNAYQVLTKLLAEKKRTNPEIKSEQYITALKRINVAVIFLDERPFKGEDPQIIFETLNSLGKPLTLSDLVRNFVLLNMESNKQSEIYEKIWHPKIEEILSENSSNFFRDYLQYKTITPLKVVNDSNTKELYQEFKHFVENNFQKHDDFIDDILRYVKCYKWIISETITDNISNDYKNDLEIKELLRNIFHDIRAEAFKPFVLGLLEYYQRFMNDSCCRFDAENLVDILKSIRTYLIRRRILGLTQGENKNIITLIKKIKEVVRGDISMFDLLTNQFYRLRLPNDEEIKKSLETMNFYEQLKRYSKFILGKIEENNAKIAVDFRNSKISIEHIMPQTLGEKWKNDLGDKYEEIHKKYLHNIGNLILTEFNSEIGNKSFEEKRNKIETSSLNYRLRIVKKDIWDEESILEHRSYMIDCFIKTFPLPEEYREKDNYNSQTVEYDENKFSPLDKDAGEMAEGNKPKELYILGTKIKVTSWQDVFIKFLKYLKDSDDFDFGFILDNQQELFRKDEVILKKSVLENIISRNADLSSRYKTFDGETYKNVRDAREDLLFIHINISAFTCLTRISNVMEKFSLDKDSVTISL